MTRAHPFLNRMLGVDPVERWGRVERVAATAIEADGPAVRLGGLCAIEGVGATLLAEVTGVERNKVHLAALGRNVPVSIGAKVVALPDSDPPVGDTLLGRILNGLGQPIDGNELRVGERCATRPRTPAPLERSSSKEILKTGIRAIDTLLPLARGQRVGIFAASGVGKTSLITQLARQAKVDRCVICLVGERGREVESFWTSGLDAEARARSMIIAATSDETAAMRARAVDTALAIASHWRDQGHHVLLVLDSITRLAMALREIGLAAGEPATVRAYTPNVFAKLPVVVEACGALRSGGAISAIMTVLAEDDEVEDPLCEAMKSLLDGHIILSRRLAERNHLPAIDVPGSVSRQSEDLVPAADHIIAKAAIRQLSLYEEARTLIEAGIYASGSNADLDHAIARRPVLMRFLTQGSRDRVAAKDALATLRDAVTGDGR